MKTDVSLPKISICIPTFNRGDLIGQTLQCVANQTVQPDEVLIVDNASTDNTQEVVKKFAKYGFTYIRNAKNIGMAENHNRCIELAKNELFTFLPSDDLIAPTWYEEWTDTIAKHDAGLYISPLTIVNNDLKIIAAFPIFEHDTYIPKKDVIKVLWKHFLTGIPPMGMYIYRKSIFNKIQKYDAKDGSECDFKVGLALLENCDVYYHHKFLFAFREHSLRSFNMKKEERDKAFFKRFENYLSILKKIYHQKYHDKKDRYFLHGTLLMNLCNINLYIARLEFAKVIRSYALVNQYFPDFFLYGDDWKAFAYYQKEFIRRALTFGRLPTDVSTQLAWITALKKEMYDTNI